uniref:Putative adenylate cyclase-coupled calcitonin receptor n=1 Tax=Xenopsylla cheopis TaxID=163159 RepID=A0A6M2E1V6_XENCH
MLEYARSAMFLWMFIEGVYLHGIVTVSVFTSQRFPLLGYCLLGWGLPALMTTAWATTTALKHSAVARDNCWYGYNLSPYYWILEGPRLGVIVLNFMFLLNIVRVLVVKLRQSNTSDIQQVRKAVRAAVVLLPLLGITNVLNMADAPLDGTVLEFALWSYITHILTSFQGFFIALIYCFLNGEVRSAIAKKVNLHLSLRSTASGSRHSLSAGTPKGLSRFWTYLCLYDKGSKNRVHRGSERRRYPRGSSTVQHDLTSIADDRDYTEVLQKLSQDEVGDAAAAVGHNMLCFTDKEDNNIALITYLKENKPT